MKRTAANDGSKIGRESMRRKAYLLAGIAGALAAFPAQAQEEPTPENVIIVTATLRAADVQDVPLAVTAVQPAELQRQGIDDIKSLSALSPASTSSLRRPKPRALRLRSAGSGPPVTIPGWKALSVSSSMVSTNRVPASRWAISWTSNGSKFCAVRREHCSAATLPPGHSTSRPGDRA